MTVHYCTLRSTSVSLFEVIFVIFVLPLLSHILLELFKLELPVEVCDPFWRAGALEALPQLHALALVLIVGLNKQGCQLWTCG